MLSAIVNGAATYSPAWRKVKYIPRRTVSDRAWMAELRFPSIIAWCAHVTETPEARSTEVFRSGTLNGFRGFTPIGGQQQPSSGVGANLLWKKAQKNAIKNQTSDTMNRIIPYRRPCDTYLVW